MLFASDRLGNCNRVEKAGLIVAITAITEPQTKFEITDRIGFLWRTLFTLNNSTRSLTYFQVIVTKSNSVFSITC